MVLTQYLGFTENSRNTNTNTNIAGTETLPGTSLRIQSPTQSHISGHCYPQSGYRCIAWLVQ